MISFTEQSNDAMIFLSNQIQGQAQLERYLNEAILMSEGKNTIENITIVNEGFVESVKEGLNKIAAFLKKMWNRFLEAMNGLIRTDKSYLTKYKDTILKNKINEDKVEDMFNWKVGVEHIKTGLNMVYTNEDQLIKDFSDIDNYIKTHFGDMVQGFKTPYKDIWGDMCKTYFHGGQDTIQVNAGELTSMLKDMYDYCYSYDTAIKSILEKDYNNFMSNAEKQLNAIIKAQGSGQFKESANIWESSQYFSTIYETYITEEQMPSIDSGHYKNMNSAQIRDAANKASKAGQGALAHSLGTLAQNREKEEKSKQQSNQNNTSGNNNSTNNNSRSSNGTNSGTGSGQNNTNTNGAQNSDANSDSGKLNVDTSKMQNADQLKQLADAVTAYVNIGQTYLTNRMSASEAAYKQYMKIMKEHVKDIVGNQNPDQKTAGSVKNDNMKTNDKKNGDGSQNPPNNNNGFAK